MSEQWNGKICPECFQGTLEQRVKRTQFVYRGHSLEYDQEGGRVSLLLTETALRCNVQACRQQLAAREIL